MVSSQIMSTMIVKRTEARAAMMFSSKVDRSQSHQQMTFLVMLICSRCLLLRWFLNVEMILKLFVWKNRFKRLSTDWFVAFLLLLLQWLHLYSGSTVRKKAIFLSQHNVLLLLVYKLRIKRHYRYGSVKVISHIPTKCWEVQCRSRMNISKI